LKEAQDGLQENYFNTNHFMAEGSTFYTQTVGTFSMKKSNSSTDSGYLCNCGTSAQLINLSGLKNIPE
jgi:hypothetical protein